MNYNNDQINIDRRYWMLFKKGYKKTTELVKHTSDVCTYTQYIYKGSMNIIIMQGHAKFMCIP